MGKYSKLAQDLKTIRQNANLTQKELSELSGVSYSSITKYETDKRQPKKEQIKRILDVLGFDIPEELLTPENLESGLFDRDKLDYEFIVSEIDRIVKNLSPKYAEKLYSYCLDLEELDRLRK